MKLEDEHLGVQGAVAASPSLPAEFASPAAAAAQCFGAPKRKRRLTEAQRLAPFSWDVSAVAPGPAILRQFQFAAEVRRPRSGRARFRLSMSIFVPRHPSAGLAG